MIRFVKAVSLSVLLLGGLGQALAKDCADDPRTTGLSRTMALDAVGGGEFGRLQYKKTAPLRPKEVVITFDDGPHPTNTKFILDVLDRHCVKATFFMVGQMALYQPKAVKQVAARGHTIGTHTWSHPRNTAKMPAEDVKIDIEKGFVAVSQALGKPVAPFFRYPGLHHTTELNAYLSKRDISVWSVDVVSGDTYPGMTPEKLVNSTMERLRKFNRGIVLFHDLKRVTADSLDLFLTQLKLEGFKVVHVVANSGYKASPALMARLKVSKKSLRNVDFTSMAPEGDFVPEQKNVMVTGDIDIMKTNFVHIDTSSVARKRDLDGAAATKAPKKSKAKKEDDPRARKSAAWNWQFQQR